MNDNMFNALERNGFSNKTIESIIKRFKGIEEIQVIIGNDNLMYMDIYGTQNGTAYTHYYYNAAGTEFTENIRHTKTGHVAFDYKDGLYRMTSSMRPASEIKSDPAHTLFEIYESKFSHAKTLTAYNPKYGRTGNLYQLCQGDIKFFAQHELAGRMFLEFKLNYNGRFYLPIMVESTGRQLTKVPSMKYSVLPTQGVIVQTIHHGANTSTPRYNIFDVRNKNNPCILQNKSDVHVNSNTGEVTYGMPRMTTTIEKLRADYMTKKR